MLFPRIYSSLLIFLLFFSCNAGKRPNATEGSAVEAPRLVVFLVVDQMRYDYFERFQDQYRMGLKRLWDEGVVFANAHHPHVPTNTGPGHATLSTGAYMRVHGILNNEFYDPALGRMGYCTEDRSARIVGLPDVSGLMGMSPRALQTSTLGDWLKVADRQSKVCAVAQKDRGSILMGGKKADRAFWFDNPTTGFVSSDYYPGKYPDWAGKIVGREVLRDSIDKGWYKAFPESYYSRSREDVNEFETGNFLPDFPHTLARTHPRLPEGSKEVVMIRVTPFGDELTLDFAETMLEEEKLGQDEHPDLLTISLSSADAIGHHFGPYSQEVQDYYLRLDQFLGDFLEFLDRKLGRDQYWVALSADHGVMPFPEELVKRGHPEARRIFNQAHFAQMERIDAELRTELGLQDSLFVFSDHNGIFLNYAEAQEKGISPPDLRQGIADAVRELDYIADVFTSDELQMEGFSRPFMEAYRRSYIPGRSPDLLIVPGEDVLIHTPTGTSHGTPYAYDTHVPVVFLGKPFAAAKYDRRVATVDMAPTLAFLLGIEPTDPVNGVVLEELRPKVQ